MNIFFVRMKAIERPFNIQITSVNGGLLILVKNKTCYYRLYGRDESVDDYLSLAPEEHFFLFFYFSILFYYLLIFKFFFLILFLNLFFKSTILFCSPVIDYWLDLIKINKFHCVCRLFKKGKKNVCLF